MYGEGIVRISSGLPSSQPSGHSGTGRTGLIDRQPSVVREFAEARFRQPGRHVPLRDHLGNLFCPFFDVGVTQQTERGRLSRAMATSAVFEHDRGDVLVKRQGAFWSRRILIRWLEFPETIPPKRTQANHKRA
ncbi:MAG: hypothetical protein DME26_00255 [Verrucomicrobia bacterium]|nr:MAG: hypothetical protein DME26_00255 [Verrucomicrobiota bacterium]